MDRTDAHPTPKDDTVRRHMELQRRRDTKPEVQLRKALHAKGYRFRVNYPVPGRPRRTIDIAFTRAKVAIFVDGCFWHSCPTHGVAPKNNAAWWATKLTENQIRDKETTQILRQDGWRVVRLWEHQTVDEQLELVEQALAADSAPQTLDTTETAPASVLAKDPIVPPSTTTNPLGRPSPGQCLTTSTIGHISPGGGAAAAQRRS